MDTISSLSALPHEIYFWYMPCIKPFGTCHVLNLLVHAMYKTFWYMPCIKPFAHSQFYSKIIGFFIKKNNRSYFPNDGQNCICSRKSNGEDREFQ